MLRSSATRIGLLVGLLLGVAVSYMQPVLASRNSSGTYSLPSGNPVVSGTTITSATHNTTMSDMATEMTDSLNRSGKGPMLAALELVDGTVAAPGLSFDNDTDCGLYRIGANNIAIATNGAKLHEFNATQSLGPDGAVGAPGLGFASDVDTGLYRIGANNPGISAGGTKSQEWTSTGTTITGNVALSGSDPTSSTGFSDTITPMNVVKAWGLITGNGGGAAAITAGFNITNIQESGANLTVDFVTDFSSTSYACAATATSDMTIYVPSKTGATVTFSSYIFDGTSGNLATVSVPVMFVCFGAN